MVINSAGIAATPMNRARRRAYKSLVKESFIELLIDVGPIPAGVYRTCGEQFPEDRTMAAGTSGEIIFSVMNASPSLFKKLPTKEGQARATSELVFLERYYTLLEESRTRRTEMNPNKPITMCCITPDILKRLGFEAHNSTVIPAGSC